MSNNRQICFKNFNCESESMGKYEPKNSECLQELNSLSLREHIFRDK